MSTISAISSIINSAGVTDSDGRLVLQLVDFACTSVADITDEARALAELAGRSQVTREDVLLAAKYGVNQAHTNPPPRALALQLANDINSQPLPPIKSGSGLRLPSDRYCLLQPTYKLQPTNNLVQIAEQNRVESTSVKREPGSQDASSVDFQMSQPSMGAGQPPSAKRVHLDDDYDM